MQITITFDLEGSKAWQVEQLHFYLDAALSYLYHWGVDDQLLDPLVDLVFDLNAYIMEEVE